MENFDDGCQALAELCAVLGQWATIALELHGTVPSRTTPPIVGHAGFP